MSNYRQQTSRDSDDLEETLYVYGGVSNERPYRPRSTASDTIPFADSDVDTKYVNGRTQENVDTSCRHSLQASVERSSLMSSTLDSEDSTSLNNLLDALDGLENSESDDEIRRPLVLPTIVVDDGEFQQEVTDVVGELPDRSILKPSSQSEVIVRQSALKCAEITSSPVKCVAIVDSRRPTKDDIKGVPENKESRASNIVQATGKASKSTHFKVSTMVFIFVILMQI